MLGRDSLRCAPPGTTPYADPDRLRRAPPDAGAGDLDLLDSLDPGEFRRRRSGPGLPRGTARGGLAATGPHVPTRLHPEPPGRLPDRPLVRGRSPRGSRDGPR